METYMQKSYNTLLTIIEKLYPFLFILLSAITAFLCFRCLPIAAIDSWDEARHGISAYEMMKNHNYLINTYLDLPDYWNVKPPLSFLTIIAGFSIFGFHALGLRFFSALFYLITVLCTGLFAKRYGKLASLFTMALLTANYFPFKAHLVRAGDADSLYLLLFTLAMLSMLQIRKNQRWLLVCALCFSLAFLTKSFHAGIIAVIGLFFLLLTKQLHKLRPHIFAASIFCALFPILLWAILRFQYDGFTFFQKMYEADLAGRTAAGGLEGHGFPFSFYLSSIFFNFDYIYGYLSILVLLGIVCLWLRPLRASDTPMPLDEQTGILLWLFIPLLLFSLVSTKLMWYVYPCIIPLCLLAAIFLSYFFTSVKAPAVLSLLCLLTVGVTTLSFTYQNYLDNVRGARSNDLQTFVIEQFDRQDEKAGATIYLDAYDPFLYANTTTWEQNMHLLAMMEGNLDCRDGGIEAFLSNDSTCLLILSIPFLQDHPALANYQILADNGQYLLLQK